MNRPNITFIDSIVGPPVVTKPWRDRVGVVSSFNRGPDVPVEINDAKTFASVFGLDSSPGSLFVQQAMANGLSNFIVSRASASSNTASTTLSATSGNDNIPPKIGYTLSGSNLIENSERTLGLKFDLNYIGDAIIANPVYSTVKTFRDYITLNNNVAGRYNFYVTKAVQGNPNLNTSQRLIHAPSVGSVALTLEIQSVLLPVEGYFVALIEKTANNYSTLKKFLVPGYCLININRTATPNLDESDTSDLIICSEPYNYSPTHDALLIKTSRLHSFSVRGVALTNSLNKKKLVVAKIEDVKSETDTNGNYPPLGTTPAAGHVARLKNMKLVVGEKEYSQSLDPEHYNSTVSFVNTTSVEIDNQTEVSFEELYSETINDIGYLDTNIGTAATFNFANDLPFVANSTPVYFIPSVTAFNSTAKTITIRGLYNRDQLKTIIETASTRSSVYFIINNVKYTPTGTISIPSDTTNLDEITITVNESVSVANGNGVYIYLKPNTALLDYPYDEKYQISIPKAAHYIMGYRFDSLSGSVASDEYKIPQSYNDGFTDVQLDGTFLLSEHSGGRYLSFGYFKKPSYEPNDDAFPLSIESFGIKYWLGDESSTKLALTEHGSFAIPFAKTSLMIGSTTEGSNSFIKGSELTSILNMLDSSIKGDTIASTLIGEIDLVEFITSGSFIQSTPTIFLTSSYSGEQANRIRYTITRYQTATVEDFKFKNKNWQNNSITDYLSGGYDGASYAYRDLYSTEGTLLWRIRALTPGIHGNKIHCSISKQRSLSKYSSFQILVKDTNSNVIASDSNSQVSVESNNLDYTTGRSLAFPSTSLVQAFFMPVVRALQSNISLDSNNKVFSLPVQRLAPPLERYSSSFSSGETSYAAQGFNVLSSFYLQNGLETSLKAPSKKSLANGMIKAIKELDSYNLAAIATPGIFYGDVDFQEVFSTVINSTLSSTPESGLRTAVFELPPGVNPDRARLLADELNSDRIVLIAGTQIMRSATGILVPNVGSSGSYLGYDLSRSPNLSPAASFSNTLVQGVTFVDTQANPSYLDKMSASGVEVLMLDSNMNGFRFCNGLTTSRNIAKRYRSVVRTLDQVKTDLYLALQWVRSRPNNSQLQAEVASACDTYLFSKLRDGWFTNLDPTICSSANNTVRDQLEGRLNIRIRFTPTFPADRLFVSTIMDISEDFSIQTSI